MAPVRIVNSVDQKQPPTIVGKKRPVLKELNSNLAQNPSDAIQPSTGSLYGPPPSPEYSTPFPLMFEWLITGRYRTLQPIIQYVRLLSANASCSGVKQGVERVGEPGRKQLYKLTVKTPAQSSGNHN